MLTEAMTTWLLPLADWAVRALLILGAAAMVMPVLRRTSAAVRHLAWTLALAGVLAVPALRPLLPAVELPVPFEGAMSADPLADRAGPAGVGIASPGGPASAEAPAEASGAIPADPADPATDPAAPTAALSVANPPTRSTATPPATAASTPTTTPTPTTMPTPAFFLILWLAGVGLFLLPLAIGWAGLARVSRRARRLDDRRIGVLANRLALRLGVRRDYRLLEGPERCMPMTFGVRRPAIVLPPEAREWSSSRLEAVLLHELAHVARRDTATQLLAEVVRALHWFDPLTWLATRRMRIEREHACDDMALAAGSRPTEYADELLGLVRSYRSGATSAAALAMARRGDVADRLEAVLDDDRPRERVARVPALAVSTLAVLVVAACAAAVPAGGQTPEPEQPGITRPATPAVPAVVTPAAPVTQATPVTGAKLATPTTPTALATPALPSLGGAAQQAGPSCITMGDSWNSVQNQSNDGRRTIRMRRPGCEFELRLEGDIQFDASDMRILSMARGARLRIEEKSRGPDHSLEVRPGPGGEPAYAYERNGRDQAFDAEARAWYDAALEALFRSTGFLADERVAALLEEGGVEAVMRELGRLGSDHVFARYAEALLEQAELDEATLRAIVRSSARRVDSDHYLGKVLEAVGTHQPLVGGLLDDYLTATLALDSDHYRTEALEAALRSGRLTDAQIEAVLRAAGTMDSDHYKTEILEGIASRYALNPDFRRAYLDATSSMDSDHYRAEVLGALLDRADLDAAEKADVLRATGMLDSDHYRSELLAEVARHGLDEPALHRAYFEVVAQLDSDHYYRESLSELLARDVDDTLLVEIIESATAELDSDHYLSELLLEVVERYPARAAVRDAIMRAMESIDSGHYRGRVAEALLRAGGA